MYITIEIQNNNGTIGNIVTVHETRAAADSAFHTIMAAAAQSNLTAHSAVILSDEGAPLRYECYKHEAEPQPEE